MGLPTCLRHVVPRCPGEKLSSPTAYVLLREASFTHRPPTSVPRGDSRPAAAWECGHPMGPTGRQAGVLAWELCADAAGRRGSSSCGDTDCSAVSVVFGSEVWDQRSFKGIRAEGGPSASLARTPEPPGQCPYSEMHPEVLWASLASEVEMGASPHHSPGPLSPLSSRRHLGLLGPPSFVSTFICSFRHVRRLLTGCGLVAVLGLSP